MDRCLHSRCMRNYQCYGLKTKRSWVIAVEAYQTIICWRGIMDSDWKILYRCIDRSALCVYTTNKDLLLYTKQTSNRREIDWSSFSKQNPTILPWIAILPWKSQERWEESRLWCFILLFLFSRNEFYFNFDCKINMDSLDLHIIQFFRELYPTMDVWNSNWWNSFSIIRKEPWLHWSIVFILLMA